MKFFILIFILILSSCSLDKNSTYWNEDIIKDAQNETKPKISKKIIDFNEMTFDEFNLFLKDYSKQKNYPDINN